MIIDLVDETNLDVIKEELINVYTKFRQCNKKIVAASKFIDFFVHDILDYTILNRESKKFMKHNSVFDIRDSI